MHTLEAEWTPSENRKKLKHFERKKMKDLSIIIPAYNEEKRIGKTLENFHHYLSKTSYSYEIIVMDDGSSDCTVALVSKLGKEIPHLRVVPLKINSGKGSAVRAGMLTAVGKIRLFSDADGSTPIEELESIIKPILTNQSLISIGSRYHTASKIAIAQPRYRRLWSRFANKIVQRLLLPGIVDPNCGFKAFDGETAERIFAQCTVNEWSFDLEVLAIARKLNIPICEVPVEWANDADSKGKISHLPREIVNLLSIRRKIGHLSF